MPAPVQTVPNPARSRTVSGNSTAVLPVPIESFDLTHPAVPPGDFRRGLGLDGLRVLHLSDLHVRRYTPRRAKHRTLRRAIAAAAASGVDLIAVTGDSMDEPGQERAAIETLRDLAEAWQRPGPPALGAHLILGNHDTPEFADLARERLAGSGIRLLENESIIVGSTPGASLRLLGLSWPEDAFAALMHAEPKEAGRPAEASSAFTLVLAHMPGTIFTAADLGLPVVLAGHTHAGQIRLSPRFAPHTSSDVPVDLATGVLRLRSTLCCVSRGVGDGLIEGLRINCPWQVPLYTLRHGPLPALPRRASAQTVHQTLAW